MTKDIKVGDKVKVKYGGTVDGTVKSINPKTGAINVADSSGEDRNFKKGQVEKTTTK